jgi:hypothetical protein
VPQSIERRRSPRVPVMNHRGVPASVCDVSLGGLAIELYEDVAVDSVQDFGLTLGDRDVVLRCRVVHIRRESRADRDDVFVAGVEFLADVSGEAALRPLQVAS